MAAKFPIHRHATAADYDASIAHLERLPEGHLMTVHYYNSAGAFVRGVRTTRDDLLALARKEKELLFGPPGATPGRPDPALRCANPQADNH